MYLSKKVYLFLISTIAVLSLQAQSIQRAVCSGNVKKVDSLLNFQDINVQDKRGRTLAHYAVACNQEEILDHLIKEGIDINIGDENEHTPLFVAVQFRKSTFFDKLIKANASINKGPSPLHRAVLNEDLDFIKQLINKNTDVDVVNDRGNTPLAIAMRQGSDTIANYLIDKGAQIDKVRTYTLKGEYLGQSKPGLQPKQFAPNVVSIESGVHTAMFSPDMKSLYYTLESRKYHGGTIMVSKQINGEWTLPKPSSIQGDYREIDPFITHDGETMFYCSNRPIKEGDSITGNIDLWMVKKEGEKWGDPKHLGNAVNTKDADWFPTLSDKGDLYFSTGPRRKSNIVKSQYKDGKYQKAVPLGDAINSEHYDYDPLIARDESYLIFASRRPDGFGNADLYISFKNKDGSWTKAKNMGEAINSSKSEYAPTVSPDGAYFFYTSGGDIYWVSTEIFNTLK